MIIVERECREIAPLFGWATGRVLLCAILHEPFFPREKYEVDQRKWARGLQGL